VWLELWQRPAPCICHRLPELGVQRAETAASNIQRLAAQVLKLLRDFSGHHVSKEESKTLHVHLSARAFLHTNADSAANNVIGMVLLDQLLLWSSFSCH